MENMDENMPQQPKHKMCIPKDILESLCSRFLINIPVEEKEDMVRLCFQIEIAHWFYLDFYRQEDPQLPGYGLQQFMEIIFKEFTFLNKEGAYFEEIFNNWKKYKHKVPVYGAIMLDEALENCILVRGCHKRISWGFPKGKVNKDEEGKDCAVREVSEETGYNIRSLMDENEYLEWNFHDHMVRLYIVPFVQSSFAFEPKTRGEIQEIKWFLIDALPCHKKDTTSRDRLGLNASSFFMVQPFVKNLRKWVSQKKQDIESVGLCQPPFPSNIRHSQHSAFTIVENASEEEDVLRKRKQEEQKRFQEIQLSSHPLLNASNREDPLRSLIGMSPPRTKPKKKGEMERSCERQPEAIRKLLTGTVGVTQVNKSEDQPLRGFGLPPEYLANKKQPQTKAYKGWGVDSDRERHSKNTITYRHDAAENFLQLQQRPVPAQGLQKRFDQKGKSHASENGLYTESRGNHFTSSENSPSRGWYVGGTDATNMPISNVPAECSKDLAVRIFGQPKRKDESLYSKQMKGKKNPQDIDETFQFHIPEFLNFKFDMEALLKTLPPPTVLS